MYTFDRWQVWFISGKPATKLNTALNKSQLPKSSSRKSTAASASAVGASVQYNSSVSDSDFSTRPHDMYNSDEDLLKEDPLYVPPSKFISEISDHSRYKVILEMWCNHISG